MIESNLLKCFFALAISIVILCAGYYPFKKKKLSSGHVDFPVGETLATGVFLGAGLLHMLPEAQDSFSHMGYHYPLAYLITGIVFLLFLWFEHIGKELYHHKDSEHPAFALLAWAMLSIHSLVIGSALGMSNEWAVITVIFLAIITHKWAESFAISVQLNKSSLSRKQSAIFFILFLLMSPLGIFLGWYYDRGLESQSFLSPLLMSASAGTFLYLGTLHGLERCVMVERCCNLRDFSFVIVGFVLMALVASYS